MYRLGPMAWHSRAEQSNHVHLQDLYDFWNVPDSEHQNAVCVVMVCGDDDDDGCILLFSTRRVRTGFASVHNATSRDAQTRTRCGTNAPSNNSHSDLHRSRVC